MNDPADILAAVGSSNQPIAAPSWVERHGFFVALAASVCVHAGVAGAVLLTAAQFIPPTIQLQSSSGVAETSILSRDHDSIPIALLPEVAVVPIEASPAPDSESPEIERTSSQLTEASPQPVSVFGNHPPSNQLSVGILHESHASPAAPTAIAKSDRKLENSTNTAPPAEASDDHDPAGEGLIDQLPTALTSNRAPAYPKEARRRGLEGTVLLELEIAETGRVKKVSIVRSSGHDLLDIAAKDAARQWQFNPGKLASKAVTCKITLPINFVLKMNTDDRQAVRVLSENHAVQ